MTLVELLIVIAILAILFSLLLPAVQSVRESARAAQCKANLRQVALGCLQHLDSQGTFPQTGAWYSYTGDADLGLKPLPNARQGGWAYSVLPFIEQTVLFNLDLGLTGNAKVAKQGERIATPLATYTCPTRARPSFLGRGHGSARRSTRERTTPRASPVPAPGSFQD